jgi:hypothetical protein
MFNLKEFFGLLVAIVVLFAIPGQLITYAEPINRRRRPTTRRQGCWRRRRGQLSVSDQNRRLHGRIFKPGLPDGGV